MALIPRGKERRSIKRYQLSDYLTIYNRNTEREMGGIGNISSNGLMLVSTIPILIGAVYNMRIILPESESGHPVILDFDARCHWCKPDVSPDYFDSGYSITENNQGIIDLVEALKTYFSFTEY
ncbi:hypothetical protein CI610_00208 [invertebrate metagenome]|uniref:PilZ domain-containing protein n=1 Tax=invertebrate metagenome TaxID=1711999 RepID=A0A2H9TC57_9ZZZZ